MHLLLAFVFSLNFSIENDVSEIKTHLEEILALYDSYELSSFKRDINDVLKLIDDFEKTADEYTLARIQQRYELIIYAHNHVIDMTHEQDQIKNEYFTVWERVSYLKRRVDNLFTYELKGGSLALDINEADKKVRKKSIYQAYSSVYEQYMRKLKGISECDYQSKIDILVKIDPILQASEQLLLQDDTRQIEKELRNIETPEEYERILLSMP